MPLKNYCLSLIDEIPHEVYMAALIIFCVAVIIALLLKGKKKRLRWSAALLLLEYVFLVMGSTVFFRDTKVVRECNLTPFWSYVAIFSGEDSDLLHENIMNVVVFVPVGFLAGIAFRRVKCRETLLIGLGLSFFIEIMQFFIMKGFSEVDDVIHNTLGCMIGYGVFVLIKSLLRYE